MTRFKLRTAILGLAAMAVLAAPTAAFAGGDDTPDGEPAGWTYNPGSGWTYNPGTAVHPSTNGGAQTPVFHPSWQLIKPTSAGGNINPCIVLGTCP